jgi:hypothetical protein
MSKDLCYYVYAYVREDGTPYYVGKGKKYRMLRRNKNDIKPPKNHAQIIVCESNLTEIGSLALERRLIRWYGRKDNGTGILRNLTDGGDGTSGKVTSEDTRKLLSQKRSGYKQSQQTKEKLRNIHLGKSLNENTKRKISIAMKNSMTDERKEKISRSQKGRSKPERTIEHKNKLGAAATGKLWINNGVKTRMIRKHQEIPSGWILGRNHVK